MVATMTGGAAWRMTARSLLDRAGTFFGLVLVALIFGALVGVAVLRAGNLELMARQTAIVCMAALGMTVVIVAGGIDPSRSARLSRSRTVVIALLLRKDVSRPGRRWRRRCRGGALRAGQRGAHHAAAGRALHRHARHDADHPRRREGARRRAPHRGADHLAERSAAVAGGAFAARRDLGGRSSWRSSSPGASLHALRPSRFGDRIERADGAAVRRRRSTARKLSSTRCPRRWPDLPGSCSSRSSRSATRTVAVGLELDVDRRRDHRRRQRRRRPRHGSWAPRSAPRS